MFSFDYLAKSWMIGRYETVSYTKEYFPASFWPIRQYVSRVTQYSLDVKPPPKKLYSTAIIMSLSSIMLYNLESLLVWPLGTNKWIWTPSKQHGWKNHFFKMKGGYRDGLKHQKGRNKGSLHSKVAQSYMTPSLYLCSILNFAYKRLNIVSRARLVCEQ